MGLFTNVVTLFKNIIHSIFYYDSIFTVVITIFSCIVVLSFLPKVINFFRGG